MRRIWSRRRVLSAGAAAAAAPLLLGSGVARAAGTTSQGAPIEIPPPIGTEERLQRIARARDLMQRSGIGAIIVEPGASLDYFTGIQWWRSERLTAAVIPAQGDPIIVTPFFEKPSIEEMMAVPGEIRTWQEDEDPLKLVADFIKERGAAAAPVGFEETNRFFILDELRRHLSKAPMVSANPVVRPLRMIKSPAELALMQAAADITIRAYAQVVPRMREGMLPADVDAMIVEAFTAAEVEDYFALVLFGEGTAYPHGTRTPQKLVRGSNVLFDCGCKIRGYWSDISRSFVFGAAPSAEQRRVWEQMRRGQDIAYAAARIGVPAGSVDDAVRRAYESWGYGPGYTLPGLSHRTGHGIGMDVHEPINLVHGETTPLAPGMCFSNEPGIYLPGKFGIRLEDCFHMTAAGPKWFSVPPPSIDDPFGRSA